MQQTAKRANGKQANGIGKLVPCAWGNSQTLISWNGRIDLQTPTVDAAGHALARVNALFAQPVNNIQAADTVMAKHDERRFVGLGIETRKFGGDGLHGNQIGAADAGELKFARLPDVDEDKFLPRLQAALDFVRRDFERKRWFGHVNRPAGGRLP